MTKVSFFALLIIIDLSERLLQLEPVIGCLGILSFLSLVEHCFYSGLDLSQHGLFAGCTTSRLPLLLRPLGLLRQYRGHEGLAAIRRLLLLETFLLLLELLDVGHYSLNVLVFLLFVLCLTQGHPNRERC